MEHDFLNAALGGVSVAFGQLKSVAADGKKALAALAGRACAKLGEQTAAFLTPPGGPGDYVPLGGRLLSKRLLLLVFTGVLAIAVFAATVAYPWMDGRLWVSRLTLGSAKAADFTGRAALLTPGGTLIYEGPLEGGQPAGRGTQYAPDGALVYRGDFAAGRYEGEGRAYEDGAPRYAGGFHENRFSGAGEAYDEQGRLVYRGSFLEGQRAGNGVELWPETGRKRYVGGFSDGLREGRGAEYGPDGQTVVYEGEFAGGAYSGAGRLYENGALRYDGGFSGGAFSGAGTLYGPAGRVLYEGGFRDGKYDGEGRLYDEETGRLVYEGGFLSGLRAGAGTEYDGLGRAVFSGNFRDGAADLMYYLGRDMEEFRTDFGAENVRAAAGGTLLLSYTRQNLAVVCRAEGDGYVCQKIVSGLSAPLAGVERGAGVEEVHAALGRPFTALALTLEPYDEALFAGLGVVIPAGARVFGEKYLRDGYFIRVYYSTGGRAAAVELCAPGAGEAAGAEQAAETEETARDVTLPDLLAALPGDAGALLDAAALEGAEGWEPLWLEIRALVGRELGEGAEGPDTEAKEAGEPAAAEPAVDAPAGDAEAAGEEPAEEAEPAGEEAAGAEAAGEEAALPLDALSEETGCWLALRLLAFAEERGLLAGMDAVHDCVAGLADTLAAEHSPYSDGALQALNAASARFADCGKLAAGVSADRLIVLGGGLRLRYAPIAYNGRLLLAAEDLAAFLGGEAAPQAQGDGLAIQADGLLLELEKGSATAFLNDMQVELAVPVLTFEGRAYVSAELLALPDGRPYAAFAEPLCFVVGE